MLNLFRAPFRTSSPNIFASAGMRPTLAEMVGLKTAQLRWLVLGPIMTILLIMMGILAASAYYPGQDLINLGLILGVAGGGLVFLFFWLLTGKMGRLMEWHQETIRHLSMRDDLTGLFNHVTFYTMLEDEVARSGRTATTVSLLMLDLDHFKDINDKFGHVTGDMVLKEFSRIIHRQSRSIDKVCRFEGEELAIILPETTAAGAMIAGERMRAAIAGHVFNLAEGQYQPITVSSGGATVPEHAASAHELVNAADRALHVAKQRGRNRVYQYNS